MLPGMGGSRLTGLAEVGEDAPGVGRLRGGAGDEGRPEAGCAVGSDERMPVLQVDHDSVRVINEKRTGQGGTGRGGGMH